MEYSASAIVAALYRGVFAKGWLPRLAGQWIALFVITELVVYALSLFIDLDQLDRRADRGISFLALGLFYSSIAIAWHRYFLQDTPFSGWQSVLPRSRSLIYMLAWAGAGLAAGAALVFPTILIALVTGIENDTYFIAVFLILLPVYVYVVTRLMLLLPAIATKATTLRLAWQRSRGHVWLTVKSIFLALLLPYAILYVWAYASVKLPDLPIAGNLALDGANTLAILTYAIALAGTLSLIVRHFGMADEAGGNAAAAAGAPEETMPTAP